MLLVLAALQARDFKSAVQAAQTLINKQPDKAMPLNLLGVAYLGLKDKEQARANFDLALKRQPEFVTAALNFARMDVTEGDFKRAKQRLNRVLNREPKNIAAMLEMATLAVASYRILLKLRPLSPEVTLRLATALASIGNYKEALVQARRSLDLAPDSIRVRQQLVRIAHANGDLDKAITEAKVLQRDWPQLAVEYVLEADVHHSEKRSEPAFSFIARPFVNSLARHWLYV